MRTMSVGSIMRVLVLSSYCRGPAQFFLVLSSRHAKMSLSTYIYYSYNIVNK